MSSCDCHENIEDEVSITNVADTAEIEDYQLIAIVAAVVLFTLRALHAEQHSALLASIICLLSKDNSFGSDEIKAKFYINK